MKWKAEDWQGKIASVKFVKFDKGGDSEHNVFELCPEGVTDCAVCGARLWHYWRFEDANGEELHVGQECARIVTGGQPPSVMARDVATRNRLEAEERSAIECMMEQTAWWRGAKQHVLRRWLIAGVCAERKNKGGDWFRRAYWTARRGALSPSFRKYVERWLMEPGDIVARRAAIALRQIDALQYVRGGMYDRDVIADMCNRLRPRNPDWAEGGPITAKQAALIDKLCYRYRNQINKTATWRTGG